MRALLLALTLAGAQDFGSLDSPPPRHHQFIAYAAEPQTLPLGKPAVLELHFQVEHGYHVNSHRPKSELLIPTRIELQPAAGVQVVDMEYPPGQEYTLAFAPREKLDVYADSFLVKVQVKSAAAGMYSLHGALKYQACDKAACYPPRLLPIDIVFTVAPAPPAKPNAQTKRSPAS